MRPGALFPKATAEEILAELATRWALDLPLPVPRGDWCRCPVCGGDPHAREWRVGPRNSPGEHRLSHRCDVSMKCSSCGHVWWHGLAITGELARSWGSRRGRVRVWDWRDARALLAGHTIEV